MSGLALAKVGPVADRWIAFAAVTLVGTATFVAFAGVMSGDTNLMLFGGSGLGVGLLVLAAAGWVDALPLLGIL